MCFGRTVRYPRYEGSNIEGHNSFMKVIEKKDVVAANIYLRAMIILAACISGMGKFSPFIQWVTRMAYSPRLWLMAIGW